MNGVDFIKLNTDGIFHAKSLKIGPAKVGVFLNRELPRANLNKGGNYPHLALRRLPIATIIDTLQLKHIDITYTEFDPITREKGTLALSNLSARILNVTNDSLQLLKNHHAIAQVSTHIQQHIKTDVMLDFDLTAPNGAFSYQGTMNSFDMKLLNPLSKSLGLVEIETGTVQRVAFDMHGNKSGVSGTVLFNYNDLKVKLLKEGEDGAPMTKKGFLSFIANTLIVKDANPINNKAPRTASVNYKRSNGASFFNLMWKSVFMGIREIVGLGNVPTKSEAQIREKIKDKKERREKRREKRSDRKEDRQEKKEARHAKRDAKQ
jgi:hypothetical protein